MHKWDSMSEQMCTACNCIKTSIQDLTMPFGSLGIKMYHMTGSAFALTLVQSLWHWSWLDFDLSDHAALPENSTKCPCKSFLILSFPSVSAFICSCTSLACCFNLAPHHCKENIGWTGAVHECTNKTWANSEPICAFHWPLESSRKGCPVDALATAA